MQSDQGFPKILDSDAGVTVKKNKSHNSRIGCLTRLPGLLGNNDRPTNRLTIQSTNIRTWRVQWKVTIPITYLVILFDPISHLIRFVEIFSECLKYISSHNIGIILLLIVRFVRGCHIVRSLSYTGSV